MDAIRASFFVLSCLTAGAILVDNHPVRDWSLARVRAVGINRMVTDIMAVLLLMTAFISLFGKLSVRGKGNGWSYRELSLRLCTYRISSTRSPSSDAGAGGCGDHRPKDRTGRASGGRHDGEPGLGRRTGHERRVLAGHGRALHLAPVQDGDALPRPQSGALGVRLGLRVHLALHHHPLVRTWV